MNIRKTFLTGLAVVAICTLWHAKAIAQENPSPGIVTVFDHGKLAASCDQALSKGGSNLLWSHTSNEGTYNVDTHSRESVKAACKPEGCSHKGYTAVVYVVSGAATLVVGGTVKTSAPDKFGGISIPRWRVTSYQQRGCVHHASRHHPLVQGCEEAVPLFGSARPLTQMSDASVRKARGSNHAKQQIHPEFASMARFKRYIGIDYSGAQTSESGLPGLKIYKAEMSDAPREIEPPLSPRKHWTRKGIGEWLCKELATDVPSIVGIDHGFSFPIAYFRKYSLPLNWTMFLDDFQQHWPTDTPNTYVDFIRDGHCGEGAKRTGDPCWLRLTEQWTATAKSVFQFDIQGAVAKSTHTGIPWLRYIRNNCKGHIHFWPFEGWSIPEGASVVAEVYPSLWTRRFPKEKRDADRQAAYAVAAWLQRTDLDGSLVQFLTPPLDAREREVVAIEGWILGVV
jgi:hypothetical protein